METKNMLGSIVSLTVVVICVAAIMMPVVSDAMETAGTPITKSNVPGGSAKYYDISDEDITILSTDNGYTINGESLVFASSYAPVFFSKGCLAYWATNSSLAIQIITDDDATYKVYTIESLVYEDGVVTVTKSANTYVATISGSVFLYAGASSSEALGNYVKATTATDVYVTMDLIEDGTMGAFGNGGTFTYNGATYSFLGFVVGGDLRYTIVDSNNVSVDTFNVEFSVQGLTVADGTTDIYTNGTPVFTITSTEDDTFSTTFIAGNEIVLKEVSGHATSGAAYSLYAAIPVIVIAGIVVASIGMIGIRRD